MACCWILRRIMEYLVFALEDGVCINCGADEFIDISECTIILYSTSYTYDGEEKTPAVTVINSDGNTLTLGTDYTVSYSNNTNAGTATVTVTGIGDYFGSDGSGAGSDGSGNDDTGSGNDDPGDTGSGDDTGTSGDTLMVRRGNTMYFNYTLKGGNADFSISAGLSTDQVLVGDWDGDGENTICQRRGNVCYFIDDITTMHVYLTVTYGRSGMRCWWATGTRTGRTPWQCAGMATLISSATASRTRILMWIRSRSAGRVMKCMQGNGNNRY
ncbi:MAG: hypothetical protein LIO80_08545 [Lachnospiraceae bacterium]|nr:hypothetical protein [Lachnospiraceae bacterium]